MMDFTGQQPITFGDSAIIDSFGRLRVSNPVSIFENKNIQSRREPQWEEPIDGVILEHGAVTGGPFQVAETVTGGTSGATGTVTIVNAGDINLDLNHNDFVVGETITGGTSGATAVLSSVDTGGNIEHLPNEAAVLLTVGQISGDRTVRQTVRYLTYVPGKSQLITLTGVFGAGLPDVRRRMGFFDDANGLLLEQLDQELNCVIRTSTSGSVVEDKVEQADWNVDKLDGNGKSKVTLDMSKNQILIIDFQWLSAGRVRFGFSINGMIHYCHEFKNANVLEQAYMGTPTLPIRYEIEALAALGATASMKEICCAVVSEGGFIPPGFEFSQSKEWSERAITARTPVFAIRLKDAFSAAVNDNRRTVKLLDSGFFTRTNDTLFEVNHTHNPSGITATWTDVDGGSGVEYSNDISTVTGNPSHKIDHRYTPAGIGSAGGQGDVEAFAINAHGFLSQNFDSTNSQMFVIYGTPRTGTANVVSHITWVEFE